MKTKIIIISIIVFTIFITVFIYNQYETKTFQTYDKIDISSDCQNGVGFVNGYIYTSVTYHHKIEYGCNITYIYLPRIIKIEGFFIKQR